MRFYILDKKGNPIATTNTVEWSNFMTKDKSLARDVVGDCLVSTVFLGIDHSFGRGKPILWETMIFGKKSGEPIFQDYQERYSTKAQALKGHQEAIKAVTKFYKNIQ